MLLVYYTYAQQTKLVADAIADVLRDRGCEVRPAAIGFADKRWAERFSRRPLRHGYRDILGMLPAQLRAATGEIQIRTKLWRAITTSSASGHQLGFSRRACRSGPS